MQIINRSPIAQWLFNLKLKKYLKKGNKNNEKFRNTTLSRLENLRNESWR
jgi:hypothetical protein